MNIAYFTNLYPRATDTFIRREVTGLRKRGLSVKTYSVRKTGASHDVDDEVKSEKKQTHYILPANPFTVLARLFYFITSSPKRFLTAMVAAFKTCRPGLKGLLLQSAYFLEAVVLARKIQQDKIDHLHNHFGDNSGNVTLFASLLTGIPFSISIHGPHIFFDALYWALDKKAHHAKFIACIGHFCTSQLRLYTDKQDWHKFHIVRCGIDHNQFEYHPPTTAGKKLVYVGRLSAEKGVPDLIRSMASVANQDSSIHLSILGDGEDRKYLEDLVKEYDLTNQVEFAGFVNQQTIQRYLRESDVFVLPSYAEGIPVALMEAMAIGTPVLTTYVAGIAELVINEETGLLFFPSDVDGLTKAIERYAGDIELCKKISEAARKKVVEEFYIEEQVDKLATLFKSERI